MRTGQRRGPVVAIVQTRMGSTRLPGKALADVAGRPLLWHVVTRAQRARTVDRVVVATTDRSSDDAIAAFCAAHDVPCYRGSEEDVLDRFYRAARRHRARVIVRLTGDCPLLDPAVVDEVVGTFFAHDVDYATNTLRPTYPDGLDVEVFSREALERAWREARLPAEREHVTPYIRSSGRFRTVGVERTPSLAALRWTVDRAEDLAFVRAVYARLGGDETFDCAALLRLLDEDPTMLEYNAGILRHEGYYRSLLHEPPMPARPVALAASRALKARAETLIPGASQTFSKGPSQFVQGVCPVFLARGAGARVWDVDGNKYVDYILGLAPVILGHADPDVTAAVSRQAAEGSALSLPHPLEIEVAELLVDLVPCAEMVRFAKSGSDATTAAVRLARAYTGRDHVACCGYHGWQDWYIGTTTRDRGVPAAVAALSHAFPYDDLAAVERIFAAHPGQVAAVVLEPVGTSPPAPGFLPGLRALCGREGALLVFDEIVTGFRFALGGAQAYFGVTPDLACFGKGLANGYPLAAVVGRREIMALFEEVFFSATFGGETVSLAAAQATLTKLRERDVVAHLWDVGERLRDGYNVLARELGLSAVTQCAGYPPRSVMWFHGADGDDSLPLKSLFQQEVVRRGVLSAGYHNVCFAHGEAEVEHTLRAYRAALDVLAQAVASGDLARFLDGPPVKPVFRRV